MAWFNFSAPFKNALAGACMLAASTSGSYAYSAYYVFGDSLSDVGNLCALDDRKLPGAPYDNGRFSNGQVWAEDVARDLGLGPLTPSYKGGNDYAVATATASKAVPSSNPITPLFVPTIRQQVSLFGLQHREKADPAALYSVWIGANDVINALIAIEQNKLTADKAEMELATSAQAEVTAIARLVGYGARNLLVGLVPDLGLIPRFNTTDTRLATTLSAYYNTQLQDEAGAAIPAGDLTYFDTFELLDEAKADPAKFGLTNVTTATRARSQAVVLCASIPINTCSGISFIPRQLAIRSSPRWRWKHSRHAQFPRFPFLPPRLCSVALSWRSVRSATV